MSTKVFNTEQLQAINSNAHKILCLAGAGSGKALKNGTKVKTPTGDTCIEDLKIGDMVFAMDGKFYPVLGVYPQGKCKIVRVEFSDGNYIDCNEDHLWFYQTKKMRDVSKGTKFKVCTTKELTNIPIKRVRSGGSTYNNLYIPMCAPCQYAYKDVPLDPYLLGLLIGDGGLTGGNVKFCNTESDVLDRVKSIVAKYNCVLNQDKFDKINYKVSSTVHKYNYILDSVRKLGLDCLSVHKFIPSMYKYNSEEIRLELLRGLIDTDGFVSSSMYEFYTSSQLLAMDVAEVVESLGMTSKITVHNSQYTGKKGRVVLNHPSYRVFIKTTKQHSILHKSDKHNAKRINSANQSWARRYITSIEPVDDYAEMTCIEVGSPDHSFLTEHYIPTHNTTVLVTRVSKLVADGKDPKSILALTFTNAAATEMRERYKHEHPSEIIPEFRTFHSFCYSLLCKDFDIRDALGYSTIPGIVSDAEEKEITELARTTCKIKMSIKDLKRSAKRNKKDAYTIELFNKAVARLMKQRNLISFDMLNEEVSLLFSANHTCTAKYKNRYTTILVDEFQDTDSHQMMFIESFPNSDIYCCGDSLQNLYSFRGTSNEYIKRLSIDTTWDKIRLHTNYRSTNQICVYANDFSVYGDSSYRIEMDAIRDGNPVIMTESNEPNDDDVISDWDAQYVVDQLKFLDGTTAILCRSNKEVAAMSDYLKSVDVPFMTNSNSILPNLIECALSDEFAMRWLASFLTSSKYGEYIRLSATVANPDFFWFTQTYGDIKNINKLLDKINALKTIAFSLDTTEDKLKEVRKQFRLKNVTFTFDGNDDLFGDEFLKFLSERMVELKETGVYVGTIHSVKGLEYDNVFVMNVDGCPFRLYGEDNKNLFYVAVTRARNRLFVLTPPNSSLWGTLDSENYIVGCT